MNKLATVLLAAAAAFSAPAFAQDNGSITLQVDSGSAMTSINDGDFVSANSGQALSVNDKVMVADGSKFTLRYGNGCTKTITGPATYIVPSSCTGAGWTNEGGVNVWNAAIIVGAGVIGAVLIDQMGDNVAPGPLSAGIRHL